MAFGAILYRDAGFHFIDILSKVHRSYLTCGMAIISGLFIYPVKSLGGIEMDSVPVTDRGFQYDRRWMLVDKTGRFLSQREHPAMALLQCELEEEGLRVVHRKEADDFIKIPFDTDTGETAEVTVWDDTMIAVKSGAQFDQWFSQRLGMDCYLVHMPDTTRRVVDARYTSQEEITSFSDAYPMLLIGQASLDDLNNRLQDPVPMNRFRPNIVVEGWAPYEEDTIRFFQAGSIRLEAVKPCARCVLTTIDQETGLKGKDPLKTLASYRTQNKKVLFGQNLIYSGSGLLKKGMEVRVI